MTITVHTTPNCPQCMMTKKFLDRRDTPYKVVDLTVDDTARALVMDTLGYRAAPVVVVRDQDGNVMDSWSGFRPDLISKHFPLDRQWEGA